MRKILVGVITSAMLALGGTAAVADDYVADPRDRSDGNGKCQEVGDPRAGDNDDNGLSIASLTESVIREALDDDECDNSGGHRPS